MPEKLKPCPFCGGEAYFKTITHDSGHQKVGFTFEIACEECKISLPKRYHAEFILGETGELEAYTDHRKQAVEDWNRRYDNAKL